MLFSACARQDPPSASADQQSLNSKAASGTEILGQLNGNWLVQMQIRDQEGNWHSQDQYREWRWYYILDGHAIQDDFITVYTDDRGNVSRTESGTNIRIYNDEEKQWYMAWIHSNGRRLATFTAVNEDDKVIMRGTNDQGREIRNTFYDIGPESFNWVQDWTFDGGDSWVPVVKIRATRID
jgi:hypothetical protein